MNLKEENIIRNKQTNKKTMAKCKGLFPLNFVKLYTIKNYTLFMRFIKYIAKRMEAVLNGFMLLQVSYILY